MLLLIVAVVFGVLIFNRGLRLESAADGRTSVVRTCGKERNPDVRAYVDGKPVKTYLKA